MHCRLCRNTDDGTLIKYSVRHYAHAECGMRKWGLAFFDRLHQWQLEAFPYLIAHKYGHAEELERRIKAGRCAGNSQDNAPTQIPKQ